MCGNHILPEFHGVVLLAHFSHFRFELAKENKYDKYAERIFSAINEIKYYYNKKIEYKNGEKIYYEPADTLATKILLGIYGCIPAFDRYFKKGIKIKSKKSISIDIEDIKRLLQYCKDENDELVKVEDYINSISKIKYSKMKLLDMYYWNIGKKAYDKENRNKKS